MALQPIGTMGYNSIIFPVETKTTGVDVKPVWDTAQRAVKYRVYTITLEWHVIALASANNETSLTNIRKLLLQPAGPLVLFGKGFGNLNVNVAPGAGLTWQGVTFTVPNGPTVTDVIWGPKPRILTWKDPARDSYAKCSWQVEVAVSDCESLNTAANALEYCWKMDYDIDRGGYSKYTFAGVLMIPQNRLGAGAGAVAPFPANDTVDDRLEQIIPDVPAGFRRVLQKRQISEDKCKLTFAISDEELVQAFPPGVVDAQARHVTRSEGPIPVKWAGTISARYEMAKNFSHSTALDYFIQLITDRKQEIQNAVANIKGRKFMVPTLIELEEPEIYGRNQAAFSFSYYIVCGAAVILSASLWKQPPNSNWNIWKQSMAQLQCSTPRGMAGLRMQQGDDVIVDICSSGQPFPPTLGPAYVTVLNGGRSSLSVEVPDPPNSFLDYTMKARIEYNDHIITHVPYPVAPQAPGTLFPGTGQVPSLGGGGVSGTPGTFVPGAPQSPSGVSNSIFHRVASPTCEIVLEGRAIRAAYPVDVPGLLGGGSYSVVQANDPVKGDYFEHFLAANCGIPIYCATWQLRYKLQQPAGTFVGIQPNPIIPFDAGPLVTSQPTV